MLIPLDRLFIDPANPRTRRDPDFIRALAANIASEGVLEPLQVKGPYPDGRFGVVNGGSRLEALQFLHPGDRIDVECSAIADEIASDPARLKSVALSPNVMRAALHPVDEFEAFDQLVAQGFTEDQVAERYGVEKIVVRQRLALARLAPEIRAAWRAGEIDADAAEEFTLTDDQSRQAAVFKKLGFGPEIRRMSPYVIRKELVGERGESPRFFKFIGREAYEAAGGRLSRFLFVDKDEEAADIVLDFPILKALVEEKIAEKCAALKKQGWGFAEPADKHRNSSTYRRVSAKKKEEKAAAGCLVGIDHYGELYVDRGVMLPGAKLPAEKQDKKAVKGKNAGPAADLQGNEVETIDAKPLPSSLVEDMTRAVTFALQDAVMTDTDLALRILVAATTPDLFGSPAKITCKILRRAGDDEADIEFLDFADVLERLKDTPRDELLRMLTARVAKSIDIVAGSPGQLASLFPARVGGGEQPETTEAESLVSAAPASPFNATLAREFLHIDFFKRAGKMRSILAIQEIDPSADVGALLRKTAKELAAIAADKTNATGWLPPELRTVHYAPPEATGSPAATDSSEEPEPETRGAERAEAAR